MASEIGSGVLAQFTAFVDLYRPRQTHTDHEHIGNNRPQPSLHYVHVMRPNNNIPIQNARYCNEGMQANWIHPVPRGSTTLINVNR